MKYLIILIVLYISCLADEHRLLITGFTKHETESSNSGQKFNECNYGGGYEYTTFKNYDEWYFGSNITVLKDSYDEVQYTLSASPNIRFQLSRTSAFSIGAVVFAMWKKDNYKTNVPPEEAKYALLFGAAPMASLYYKSLSVNFAYVPSFSFKNIDTVGFGILYFGWVF